MRLIAIAMAWVTSVMSLLLIAGHGPWAGRTLFGFGGHGVHAGDVPVLLLWLWAMLCCVELWRRGAP